MFLTCTDFITFFLFYIFTDTHSILFIAFVCSCLSCMWSCCRSKWIQLMSLGTIIVRVIGSWEGIEGLSYIYLTQASWIFSNLEVLLIYIYLARHDIKFLTSILGYSLILNIFLVFSGYGGATENKSLYAVMKIVYALNSKNHISYRDSRLTHQLHHFLSLESRSVVIACLVCSFDNLSVTQAVFFELLKGQVVEKCPVFPTKYKGIYHEFSFFEYSKKVCWV